MKKQLLLNLCFVVIFLTNAIVKASIVYTDIKDVTINTTVSTYTCDINNDAQTDFTITHNGTRLQLTATNAEFYGKEELTACNGLNFAVAPIYINTFIEEQNLIDSTYTRSGLNTGNFCGLQGKGDRYIAFVLWDSQTDGHYGYIRVNISANGSSITIKDFAYETELFEPLNAHDGNPKRTYEVFRPFFENEVTNLYQGDSLVVINKAGNNKEFSVWLDIGMGTEILAPTTFNLNDTIVILTPMAGQTYYSVFESNFDFDEKYRVLFNSASRPVINYSGSFNSFIGSQGNPSAVQTITLSATNLVEELVVSTDDHFQLSLQSAGTFSSSITINPTAGTITNTPMYVRYNPTTTGPHQGLISLYSYGGAIHKTLLATGSASVTATPSISVSTNTLATFNSTVNNASSASQVTLTGSNLTNNVTVTAPTHFEVSLSQTTGFTSTVNITATSGSVDRVIYVRYKPTASGTHTGNVSFASTGAITKTVAVSGTATPNSITQLQTLNTIKITPNPATEQITIGVNNARIEILDAIGNLTLAEQIIGEKQLDISSLAPGMYWVKAYKQEILISVSKLIKN